VRIKDAATGQLTDVAPPHGRPLRVSVHTGAGPRPGPGDVRAMVVSDVLFRVAEADGTQVVVGYADGPPYAGSEDDRLLTALGVNAPAVRAAGGDMADALGGAPDVSVVAAGVSPPGPGGLVVAVGPVLAPPPPFGLDGDDDPDGLLALRLALLGRPHAGPADLAAPDVLTSARERLARWRRLVADWSGSVSRPMHEETARRVRSAFHDNLDTPAALDALTRLAALDAVPDGARFEAFLDADRVLALELPRDIGR